MKTLHFSIDIHDSRKHVWQTMLDPEGFRRWTSAFAKGSHFEGSWEEGETVRFLDGDGSGLVSRIAENRPEEFLSIMHLGLIHDGRVDRDSPEVKAWAPIFENYRLVETDEGTEVRIAMDVTPEYEQQMSRAWPSALTRLKQLCERPQH